MLSSPASDRKSKRKPQSTSESDDQKSHDADAQSSETGSATNSVGRREKVKGHTGYMPSDAYRPASQPMREATHEEEEEEEAAVTKDVAPDGVVTPADLSEVPWHHAQLYKMYGRNADYYIHPKMQVEKKKVVHPTLKRQKGKLRTFLSLVFLPLVLNEISKDIDFAYLQPVLNALKRCICPLGDGIYTDLFIANSVEGFQSIEIILFKSFISWWWFLYTLNMFSNDRQL